MPFRGRRCRGLLTPVDVLRPDDPVDRLRGIGPKSAAGLAAHGVTRVLDLLLHVPLRYEDRTRTTPVPSVEESAGGVLVRGRVRDARVNRSSRRGIAVVEAVLEADNASLALVWFNQRWLDRRLQGGGELYLYGPVRRLRSGRLKMVNPEIGTPEEGESDRLVPVYAKVGPLSGRRLRRVVGHALAALPELPDPLPNALRSGRELPRLALSLTELHAPTLKTESHEDIEKLALLNTGRSPFHLRLAHDEALSFYCTLMVHGDRRQWAQASRCRAGEDLRERVTKALPFRLTRAQKRVTGEIVADLCGPSPMARLVQGDVGSGKTVVAALALLVVVGNGHQGAMMAPTELLAEQHYESLRGLMAAAGCELQLLTSSLPIDTRREVRRRLADGTLSLVVGTHALFQEKVVFRSLGLVVVDEQHRFGAMQRQRLVDKGRAPHLMVMTATPIPRTLALTVYGDLDVSVIDELPPGRRPVRTVLRPSSARGRVLGFLRDEVARGGRAFWVCPLISSSEKLDARALEEVVQEVRSELPGIEVGMLHGRMDREEREEANTSFRSGAVQVLLATSVVEVGVDVPEATVMVVESAERFGLSQLHQLRGRVGRGSRSSWCILLVDDHISPEARQRLELFCSCHDGFEIAEADMALRGPGELAGSRQWGRRAFRFVDLLRDHDLLEATRTLAYELADAGELEAVRERLEHLFSFDPEIPVG